MQSGLRVGGGGVRVCMCVCMCVCGGGGGCTWTCLRGNEVKADWQHLQPSSHLPSVLPLVPVTGAWVEISAAGWCSPAGCSRNVCLSFAPANPRDSNRSVQPHLICYVNTVSIHRGSSMKFGCFDLRQVE